MPVVAEVVTSSRGKTNSNPSSIRTASLYSSRKPRRNIKTNLALETDLERYSKASRTTKTSSGGHRSVGLKTYRPQVDLASPMSPRSLISKSWQATLPNESKNFCHSPVAKRALQDGSLDPMLASTFSRTFNRKIKIHDTFTSIFPAYTHEQPTCYQPTVSHTTFKYGKLNPETGRALHRVDRKFYHKKDDIKVYSEEMYKVASMRRKF